MNKETSHFVISLDFELLWGVLDSRGEEYFESIEKVHIVIPKILKLFEKYQINCTWATVGAVMANDYDEFVKGGAVLQPSYINKTLSPYSSLAKLKLLNRKLLFGPDLVKQILESKGQELASHTYAHYYCLESGQTLDEFSSDLKAWRYMAEKYIDDKQGYSLVFPRNQFDSDSVKVCRDNGFKSYRGNPKHWAYTPSSRTTFDLHKRIFRLIDSYIPLSGSLGNKASLNTETGLINIPASLFFRPYNPTLKFFEKLKVWRFKYSLKKSAQSGEVFHLWWHPHNFSRNTEENLAQLEELFLYYKELRKKYGIQSANMHDIAELVISRGVI
ncbi:MAG: hypothetical protein ACI8SR_001289 [Oceanicoccus sp.]|jgi:hypothetical protein